MTLIIALKCDSEEAGEGILVAADRKATSTVSVDVEKIVPIFYEKEEKSEEDVALALASGAGRAGLVRQLIRQAELILQNLAKTEWEEKHPTYSQFEKAIDLIQDEYTSRITELREKGIDAWASILICGVDPKGKVSMYEFDSDGVACPVHDSPGFSCLGSGFVTGGNMILRQFWDPRVNSDTGTTLGAYVIEMVSKVDPGVGSFDGSSYLFKLVDGEPCISELEEKSKDETLEDVKLRSKILKMCWDLCDLASEKEVLKNLTKLWDKSVRYYTKE